MGECYTVRCRQCDQSPHSGTGISLGCGLRYPEVCQSIYLEMKAGEYGEEARRILSRIHKPGIYQQRAVFVCGSCGKWDARQDIRICRRKGGLSWDRGSSLDQEREKRVTANMKPLCYFRENEYETLWQARNDCAWCGGQMTVESDLKKLRCNRCGGPTIASMDMCWD